MNQVSFNTQDKKNVTKRGHKHSQSLLIYKQTMQFAPNSVMALCPNPPILCQHVQIPVETTSVNKKALLLCSRTKETVCNIWDKAMFF